MPTLETIGPWAWLIPAFTAAAFVVILCQIAAGRAGQSSAWVAIGGIFLSMLVALPTFFGALGAALGEAAGEAAGHSLAEAPAVTTIVWAPYGTGAISFGTLVDPLSAAMVAMVTVVCLMIFIYASAYMEGEFTAYVDPKTGAVDHALGRARYARFFAFVSLFATGMLGFVLSSNLLQALIFWEVMGLCSFLLIGFWYYKPSAAAAAKKAFLTTRIGDLFFFLGILALYGLYGSVDYTAILSKASVETLHNLGNVALMGLSLPIGAIVTLLIFGGAVGKSAQFPLHVWLPDAMEGPTPVSALIHAATMVAAGVFLVARMYPLFAAGNPLEDPGAISGAMFVVAAIGAFTALFAATIGAAQFDIKRVLAYSTVSQLGYMIMALGIGAYVAAVFHLITHAFFKALLFLGSGSVIHGVEHGMHHAAHPVGGDGAHESDGHGSEGHGSADHASDAHGDAASTPVPPSSGRVRVRPVMDGPDPHDPQDMRNMGHLRTRMPLTYWTFLAGTLALTGIPVFAGFWSKDEILADAFHKGVAGGVGMALIVYIAGTLAAFMTAFYMSRQVFMVFFGPPSSEGARHAPESAPRMVYPLVFLSIFAVFLGFVGIHEGFPVLGPMFGNPIHHFLGHLSTGAEFESAPFDMLPMLISIAVALAGWGLGYLLYGRDPAAARARDPLRRLGGIWTLLNHKYYVDEIYSATFVRLAYFAAWVNAEIDTHVVDRVVNLAGIGSSAFATLNGWVDNTLVDGTVNLVAYVNGELSRGLRRIQSGRVQQYLLVVFIALAILLGAFVRY